MSPYRFDPIGIVRSPYHERSDAPRQAVVTAEVRGQVELVAGHGYEHALEGLEAWERAWIIFVFHRNVEDGRGWRPKVLPPRSDRKQGVFATRSPHRPNPIGLTCVVIERVEGLSVCVRGLDLLDGTPVLDIKPYVAYADAFSTAQSGWLAAPDPIAAWKICFSAAAASQLQWLHDQGLDLRTSIESALSLGPAPHPYRRIRSNGDGSTLSVKDWRVDFSVVEREIHVARIRTGYRQAQLVADPSLVLHRTFVSRESDGPPPP